MRMRLSIISNEFFIEFSHNLISRCVARISVRDVRLSVYRASEANDYKKWSGAKPSDKNLSFKDLSTAPFDILLQCIRNYCVFTNTKCVFRNQNTMFPMHSNIIPNDKLRN